MSMVGIIRFLRGTVEFEVKGRYPEKLLNLAAANDIPLWGVARREGRFFACVHAREYKRLRPLARKGRVRLRAQKRAGLPFFLRRFRARPGVVAGAVVFCLTVWFLSLFVWNIEITGVQALPPTQITESARELGVQSGVLKRSLNLSVLKEELMLKMPEVSWATMYIQGSTLTIDLRERQEPPTIVPKDTACNVKAMRDGVILLVQADHGSVAVEHGDVVVAGDLLISGMQEDAFGQTLLSHASGKVWASTTRVIRKEVPLHQTVALPTGKTIVRNRLALFGVEIPLSLTFAPQDGLYERTFEEEPVRVLGVTLPASRYTEVWHELREEEVEYTPQQAQELALKALEEEIAQTLKEVKVVGREDRFLMENGCLVLEATLDCEEDIAVEEEIIIG